MTTQELLTLPTNTWTQSLLLDANGRIEQQLFLLDDGATTWIHIDREKSSELVAYLKKMQFMLDVSVDDVTDRYRVLRTPGITDSLGGPFEIRERNAAIDFDAQEIGMWALEAQRVAAHRARILFETDHKSIPNELGLLGSAVHMNKGCYRGQETVAKVFNLGHPPRRLVALHLDGSMVDLPAHGDAVLLEDREVGYIGTVARHYELGPIALAVVKRTVPVDATLVIGGIAASQEVIVSPE
jgi:folate-binding protein YgfZ